MRKAFVLAAYLTCAASISVAQQVINLGETPWKFTKVIKNESNLASGKIVKVGERQVRDIVDDRRDTYLRYNTKDAKYITIDLLKETPIDDITLKFGGDSVCYIATRIEVSNDNSSWKLLSTGDAEMLSPIKTNDITTVNDTYGFKEVTTQMKLTSAKANGAYRFVRVNLSQCLNAQKKPIECKIDEIEVHPVSEYRPDAYYLDGNLDLSAWETVGIPHCYNEFDTFLNATTGERCWRGEGWYRKNLFIPNSDKGKQLFLEFYSVNIGTTVYVNGHAIEGNSAVKQPGPVTHVGSSLPFVVDITPYVEWGKENLLAVKVSNSKNTFFTYPNFAENEGFGQAMGGIVSKVLLHKKAPVHIPFNSYSPLCKWGTYFATLSANSNEATLRFQTNVENSTTSIKKIELRTRLLDKRGKAVLTIKQNHILGPGQTHTFDQTRTIKNPTLWYPVTMKTGPYLYTVENCVYVDGKLQDTKKENCGIRTVSWDEDYCYINGEKCILHGFGNRNYYPGLGAALPEAFQWREIKIIAQCGGNVLRVGHQAPFVDAFNACDEYGVMLIVNSGDNEWSLKNEPAKTYKSEYDRDLIIAMRNHPSVIVWESNNGLAYDGDKYLPSQTLEQVEKWDHMTPRIVLNRDGYPPHWDKSKNIVVGYTNRYEKQKHNPSLNTEVYGTNWSGNPSQCIARFDYNNEKPFTRWYVQNYLDDLRNKACGWIDWMLAETYGEGYTIYLNGMRDQKSLGSCAMDQNRFPKLKYRVYEKALWMPYSLRPGVALQSHWNYSGVQEVDAWSNCPFVELFLNGKSQGVVAPDSLTRQCNWKNIQWEAGELKAVGLDAQHRPVCSESVHSADTPYALKVNIEPQTTKPSGEQYLLTANASDAFVVTVTVVDKDGNWCPWADNMLTFSVEGEGAYKGGYNFYVAEGKPLDYHAPGDHELQAEGGLMRVAVRTTFNPGKIKVKVTSPGLVSGEDEVVSIPVRK